MGMRLVIVVEPNHPGIEELVTGPGVVAHVTRTAEVVADAIRNEAPVNTGDYVASIAAHPAEVNGTTVSAMVTTSDPFWHLIEFGSENNPAYRPFSRGVTAVGLDYQDTGGG